VAGCNQKSNRDPVVSLETDAVDSTLLELKDAGLAIRVLPATGRTERWKHNIKEAWNLERPERAVIAELMLRGPQSEGELRGRASRMVEIPTLEELRAILEKLAVRGFVLRLTPEGRKRGVIWTQTLCSPSELDRIKSTVDLTGGDEEEAEEPVRVTSVTHHPAPVSDRPPAVSVVSSNNDEQLAKMEREIAALRDQVADLREQLQQLSSAHDDVASDLRSLRDALG
jgi:uncharacterized protein YceH (UPF0502 family)